MTLMKSRFSAYAKGKAKYVVMTTHSENEIKKDGEQNKERSESEHVRSGRDRDVRKS